MKEIGEEEVDGRMKNVVEKDNLRKEGKKKRSERAGKNSVKDINKSWLSTDEAAKYLGKTRNAIWQLVSKGFLIKRKWCRRLYFKKIELDQLIENS